MKRVEVLVRAFQLSELMLVLSCAPIADAIATELWDSRCRRAGGSVPILKLELVVHDDLVPRVVSALERAASRLRPGEALVLVEAVVAATGLPHGEVDEAALG